VRWRWQVLRGLLRTLAWATATPRHLKGAEFRPRADTPCVIVANHASYLDALALIAVLPNPVTFVAKTELRSQFAVRLLLERLDTEFVDRFQVEQSLRDAQRLAARVGAGHSLLFFPEGTFTRRPGLLSFRLGAFLAAAAAGTPLLPVAIRGTRSILRSDSWFPRRGAINIALSAPISLPTSEKGDSRALWNNALRLRNAAREIILAQTGEPDLGREGSPVEPPAVANPAS
jgi:1-acyl-sn-glycerol-3-phosphate acyltransferase